MKELLGEVDVAPKQRDRSPSLRPENAATRDSRPSARRLALQLSIACVSIWASGVSAPSSSVRG
jgi:hypothetical protein